MRAALAMISNASDVLRRLLIGNHSKIAGRLAGAFRNIGRDIIAQNIIETMKSAGYNVSEKDPFENKPTIVFNTREVSPRVNRLRMSWADMRISVLKYFSPTPEIAINSKTYLKKVDEIYVSDAYHSLSIEGYQVNNELIERVRTGKWDPDKNKNNLTQTNTLAARGYWQAFKAVKKSLKRILDEENPSTYGIFTNCLLSLWFTL